MINLFPEAAALGGVGGGLLGGILGHVGDALSAPRRALWSLAGLGDKTGADLVGEDPDSPLAQILGFGLEMATDPLTLVGGVMGGLGGRAAGKGLSRAAEAAGPGYSSELSKLTRGAEGLTGGMNNSTLGYMMEQDAGRLGKMASQLPEGSSLLGAGGEGVAYRTPQGNVVRMQADVPGMPGLQRAVAPEVLQPASSVATGNLMAEHLPLVRTAEGEMADVFRRSGVDPRRGMNLPAGVEGELTGIEDAYRAGGDALRQSALKRGLELVDSNTGQNLGRTAEGKWLTFDPGLFEPGPGSGIPSVTPTPLGQGGVVSRLAEMLGGRGRLRNYLERPFSTAGQGV